jgi:putative transposase
MSRPRKYPEEGTLGDCYDNAMMEAFGPRMRVELLDSRRWKTRAELRTRCPDFSVTT